MPTHKHNTNSEDFTDRYNPLIKESEMATDDITKTMVAFPLEKLVKWVIGLIVLVGGLVTTAVLGYIDMKSDIAASIKQSVSNGSQIIALRCDVFEIRNTINVIQKMPQLKTPKECQ